MSARSWNALETHGVRVGGIDRRKAFEDVRRVTLSEGELLVEAGSSPAFVYIPVGCSLRIEQLGGYRTSQSRRGYRSVSPASCAELSGTAR